MMNYNTVSVVYIEKFLLFENITKEISLSDILMKYLSKPINYTVDQCSQMTVFYLNLFHCGKQTLSADDKNFISCSGNPDVLFPKNC